MSYHTIDQDGPATFHWIGSTGGVNNNLARTAAEYGDIDFTSVSNFWNEPSNWAVLFDDSYGGTLGAKVMIQASRYPCSDDTAIFDGGFCHIIVPEGGSGASRVNVYYPESECLYGGCSAMGSTGNVWPGATMGDGSTGSGQTGSLCNYVEGELLKVVITDNYDKYLYEGSIAHWSESGGTAGNQHPYTRFGVRIAPNDTDDIVSEFLPGTGGSEFSGTNIGPPWWHGLGFNTRDFVDSRRQWHRNNNQNTITNLSVNNTVFSGPINIGGEFRITGGDRIILNYDGTGTSLVEAGGFTCESLVEDRIGLLGTGWGNSQEPGGTADTSKYPYFRTIGSLRHTACQYTGGIYNFNDYQWKSNYWAANTVPEVVVQNKYRKAAPGQGNPPVTFNCKSIEYAELYPQIYRFDHDDLGGELNRTIFLTHNSVASGHGLSLGFIDMKQGGAPPEVWGYNNSLSVICHAGNAPTGQNAGRIDFLNMLSGKFTGWHWDDDVTLEVKAGAIRHNAILRTAMPNNPDWTGFAFNGQSGGTAGSVTGDGLSVLDWTHVNSLDLVRGTNVSMVTNNPLQVIATQPARALTVEILSGKENLSPVWGKAIPDDVGNLVGIHAAGRITGNESNAEAGTIEVDP